jgi:hypothetical protein
MRGEAETRPCEFCGLPVTKTATQQSQRKYWTCNASCANKLRIRLGNMPNWPENPDRGMKETKPCANCGKPVTRYLSQRTRAQFWTCSRQCLGIVRNARLKAEGRLFKPTKPRRGTETPCAVCGKPVYANKGQREKGQGRYCSRVCQTGAQTKTPVIKACKVCGNEIRLKPSQAAIETCSRACQTLARIARPLERMHNGRPARLDVKGYVLVWEPNHPNTSQKGWQLEHRLVVEKRIGRYLRSDEAVHHINQVKGDNRDENLELMDAVDHAALSARDYRDDVADKIARLAEYERRFGPLAKED